jgi:polysaccharide biosynthesis transport protein
MSIAQFLIVLKARWRSVLTAFLLTIAATALLSWVLPKQYTATASVLVDMKTPDPLAAVVLNSLTGQGYMATQVDVIQSERVVRRVIRALNLHQDRKSIARWEDATQGQGDFEAWLAETMLKKLEIRPTRESGVMTIAFTADSSRRAADIANGFVRAYIDTTLELRTEPAKQYNNFFDTRASKLREELEAAQGKLSAYQRKKGIIATTERIDIEASRLAELSSQLAALQGLAAESESRQRQATRVTDSMPEVLNSPVVTGMMSELSRQSTRLEELSSRLGDLHPQVVETRAKIDQLRAQIATESRRVSASLGVNNVVNQARIGQVRAALEQQRAKVLQLQGERDEVAVLQRQVENATRAYDAVLSRASQSSLESQATQTNVSILKEASPPPLPSSPKFSLNVSVALVLGLLLGLAVALVRELRDPRVRSDRDLEEMLKLTVLAVMPRGPAAPKPVDPPRLGMLATKLLGR